MSGVGGRRDVALAVDVGVSRSLGSWAGSAHAQPALSSVSQGCVGCESGVASLR